MNDRRTIRRGLLLILLTVGLIVGAMGVFAVLTDCTIDPLWEFDEIPDLGLQTTQDVMWWVATEIRYQPDSIHYPQADEYWQSPAQTYVWRTGDCEDYAILALYLVHRDVGIDGAMACGTIPAGFHAWVFVDGHFWEPQTGEMDPPYTMEYLISYADVMRRATTTHRRLTNADE